MWIELFRNAHRGRKLSVLYSVDDNRALDVPSAGALFSHAIDGIAAKGT